MNRNKKHSSFQSFLLALLLVTVGHSLAAEVPASVLESRLKQLYPGTQVTSVAASELPGLFEVVMGKNITYTDANGMFCVEWYTDGGAERFQRIQGDPAFQGVRRLRKDFRGL